MVNTPRDTADQSIINTLVLVVIKCFTALKDDGLESRSALVCLSAHFKEHRQVMTVQNNGIFMNSKFYMKMLLQLMQK